MMAKKLPTDSDYANSNKNLEAEDYEILELRKDSGNIVRAVLARKKERNDEYGD